MRDLPDDPDPWLADRLREIGDRVRAERIRQNLTQDKVFLTADVDRVTYQRLEAGKNTTMATVLRVCHVLDLQLGDLM